MDIVLVVLGGAAVCLIVVTTIEAILDARVNDEYTLLDDYWDEEDEEEDEHDSWSWLPWR